MESGIVLKALSVLTLCVHLLGIANAAHAVMNVRSSQSALAWAISLITFPWLAIPFYWTVGRTRFRGYAEAVQTAYQERQKVVPQMRQSFSDLTTDLPAALEPLQQIAQTVNQAGFTSGNGIELLIDGKQTYEAMLAAIAVAKDYILLQSYCINDDEAGNEFRKLLVQKSHQGVRVYVLYDEIGSKKITRSYLKSLRQHGIRVSGFKTTKGKGNRLQLNFRNHRKILVVDGETALVGGLNIGDEYLGKDPRLSPWRDTHTLIRGTAVQFLQRTFVSDWYWATAELPELCWQVHRDERNEAICVFPTGPASNFPACTLFFVNLINQAQNRLWIASPYLVPDEPTLTALKLAAVRGVDVRIMLPSRPDHLMVYLCSFSYYAELQSVGIRVYRYQPGFMHQKVILVDDAIAGVGTVNLDNRSFSLNFEVMNFVASLRFIESVEKMLLHDFAMADWVDLTTYAQEPLWFKLAVRVSRLLAPLL